jgi:hypothetical protein
MHQDTPIDASNTILVIINAITLGLRMAGESSHDYSSVVPKSATLSLLIGLGAGTDAARPLFLNGRKPHQRNKAT